MRSILLLLLGIPLPIVILIALFVRYEDVDIKTAPAASRAPFVLKRVDV